MTKVITFEVCYAVSNKHLAACKRGNKRTSCNHYDSFVTNNYYSLP